MAIVLDGTNGGTYNSGLYPGELIYRLNTAYAGSNVNTAQSLFGVGTTLSGSTVYQFESVIALSKSAGTTGAYIQFLFGGTATLNNIYYNISWEFDNTSFTTFNVSPANTIWVQTASATQASVSTTTAAVFYRGIIKGTVSVNAGGTFIPQYQLSAAPGGAYTTAAGSYIKLSPMSASGANTSIGTWA
jgi:hypothetical protein